MKNLYTLFSFLITVSLSAQDIKSDVFSNGGGRIDNINSVSFSIGQPIVGTISNVNNIRQGFQQPSFMSSVLGCMDSLACNYDSLATLDDGSCSYSSSGISTITSCDSYVWDGITYTLSGTYSTMYTNSTGCDSVHTLYLTINESNSGSSSITACESFYWEGTLYTSSGTYSNVLTNSFGCDSVHTLYLTINDSNSGTSTISSCESFSWEGATYTSSGTYSNVLTNSSGCDSTHTIYLTITQSNAGSSNVTSCDSYSFDGITYTSSGTYSTTYTNSSGCDSVHTLYLTINSVNSYILQSGNNLTAETDPVGLSADWYNIQTENNNTRIWLMQEDSYSFSPKFDCSYFIIVESDFGCIDTSSIYYYSENAKKIGNINTNPNPTSNIVNAQFDNPKNQNVKLELINSNGIKLDEFFTINDNLDIDLSKYPSGTYYLYFNSKDAVQGCRLEEVQKISSKIILNK